MAKRRNAPALFELLREAGGSGTASPASTGPSRAQQTPEPAPNSADPGGQRQAHRPAATPPRAPATAADASPADDASGSGSGIALSTPRFAAKPSATAGTMPTTKPAAGPASNPRTPSAGTKRAASVRPTKPVQVPAPSGPPPGGTANQPADRAKLSAEKAAQPATVPATGRAAPDRPEAQPKADPKPSTAATPSLEPAPAGGDRPFVMENGRVRISTSTGAAAAVAAALIVCFVGVWALAYAGGRSAERGDRASALTEDAGRAAQLTDPEETAQSEPSPLTLLEPRPTEPERSPPTGVPVAENPIVTPDAGISEPAVAAADLEQAQPEPIAAAGEPEPVSSDSRQAGLNYLALGQLSDPAEARRTVEFLEANGVPALAVEGRDRAGNTQYRLFTLLGVPGAGFRSNPERIDHQRRVFELGERWIQDERGQLDFSRASQVQWTKYNP